MSERNIQEYEAYRKKLREHEIYMKEHGLLKRLILKKQPTMPKIPVPQLSSLAPLVRLHSNAFLSLLTECCQFMKDHLSL